MNRKIVEQLSLLISIWGLCMCQKIEQNLCSRKETCSECIRTASCAWCFQAGFIEPRCFDPAMEGGNGRCDEAFVFNPDYQRSIDPFYNRDLSGAKEKGSHEKSRSTSDASSRVFGESAAASEGNIVQIKPQRIKLNLRLNQTQKLDLAYSQAQDYPIDLYYLMDLSSLSMKNHKEKLSSLGQLLSSTMKNFTSNFRIGFGSFASKVVDVSTVSKNLESPCTDCTAPCGFKNHMSLSADTHNFDEVVKNAEVSGNLAGPGSGFDAIMQAVACKQQIGWRDQARKLLVFSTDAEFHHAGDGKVGGMVQPNDGHMDTKNNNSSEKQDYPSISQMNKMVKKHSINLIFLVTHDQISIYEQLSKQIEGSSSGVLSDDSSNVVDLVRAQYHKISSMVVMKDNSWDAVQVAYYSSCLGDSNDVKETNKCDGLKVGDVIQFSARITLKECPKNAKDWKQEFKIYPVGISESLTVELDMICDCPCEHPGHFAYDASPSVCRGQGISACGVCVCNPGHFGKSCECSGVSSEHERSCRPYGVGPLCSNRGTCSCGQCDCDSMPDPTKLIYGSYCECDNFTCDRRRGKMCSGPDHGRCECGLCMCNERYSGPACECLKDQEVCRSAESSDICSGNGICVCGKCVCKINDDKHYSGQFCEKLNPKSLNSNIL